jgi:hypothetical protein
MRCSWRCGLGESVPRLLCPVRLWLVLRAHRCILLPSVEGALGVVTHLKPAKWDNWQEDWVIVKTDRHERSILGGDSEAGQPLYCLVLTRIQSLAGRGLTSLMIADFLACRIAPLQHRVRPARKYTGGTNATQVVRLPDSAISGAMLRTMLEKLCMDNISKMTNSPPNGCQPLSTNQGAKDFLLKEMLTLDDLDLAVHQLRDSSQASQCWGPRATKGLAMIKLLNFNIDCLLKK